MFQTPQHIPAQVEHCEGDAPVSTQDINMDKYGECYDPKYRDNDD